MLCVLRKKNTQEMEKELAKLEHHRPQCFLSAILVSIGILIAAESLYFGVVGKHVWRSQLAEINGSAGSTSIARMAGSGAAVYILLLAAIMVFVVWNASTPTMAMVWGALLGAAVYGVFNFTNFALFPGYRGTTVAIDTLWGILLCSVISGAAAYASYNWIIIKQK